MGYSIYGDTKDGDQIGGSSTSTYNENAIFMTHKQLPYTRTRRITTYRSTTDRIHDGGPIRLYYNTIVLQLPTVFSTVTCCTGL